MNNEHYNRVNLIAASPQQVYKALTTGLGEWWTKPDKIIERVNDEITFRFDPNPTYWTMRVEKLIKNEILILKCIGADHVHDGLPNSIRKEWLDTVLEWEITPEGDKTSVKFEHKGLLPILDCYEICEAGWDYFFMNSLKNYLEKDEGTPVPIEDK